MQQKLSILAHYFQTKLSDTYHNSSVVKNSLLVISVLSPSYKQFRFFFVFRSTTVGDLSFSFEIEITICTTLHHHLIIQRVQNF